MRWTWAQLFTFPIKRLVRYLINGLLFWVPLGVTFFVVKLLVTWMDRTLLLLPPQYRPEQLIGFAIPGLGIVLAFFVLLITGFIFGNIFGKQLLDAWERVLNRIPIVRSVYNGVKQVAETVLSDSTRSFKKVALLEYPRKGLWVIGFETSSNLGEAQARTGKEVVCVFVPTTPNPTSGFILFVPRDDLIELDMSVDEAIKMVISMGVIVPYWNQKALPVAPEGTDA